ncbi:MAG: type III-B CRISPR module RAMP protein Cmr6 [Anaerolineales bacterium]|jgi:CRISPR-associated protein Cmr6
MKAGRQNWHKSQNRPHQPQGKGGKADQPATPIQYPLPKEVVAVFQHAQLDNPGLVFDRFAPDFSQAGKKNEWRKQALEKSRKAPHAGTLKAYQERWQALVKAAGATPFRMKTDWRFIPGLGRKSALEIGFSFHRYGFPFLPGSSVKGLARAWALYELAYTLRLEASRLDALDKLLEKEPEEFEKERDKFNLTSQDALKMAKDFRAIFGTLDQAGAVVFFDAIPAEQAFPLDIDIMTPHYGSYYQGKSAPTDSESPNPVTFLTVPAGKTFWFAIGGRKGVKAPELEKLLPLARRWLENALVELGAGAKTAAGYGYFQMING